MSRHSGVVAGILLLGMIVMCLVSDMIGRDTPVGKTILLIGGACGWAAGISLLGRVRRMQQVFISFLLITGLVLIAFAYTKTGTVQWGRILTVNAGLLSMIISVGFLKIIAARDFEFAGLLPEGRQPFRDTILTVAVFGSFINISAPILVADRLSQNRALTRFQAATLTKTFSACSAWSPFFGSMAVVLTYVEDMRLLLMMLFGFPFAIACTLYVYYVPLLTRSPHVDKFRGYPLKFQSLWIPAALACIVMALTWFFPTLSILTVIALGSLILTSVALVWQESIRETFVELANYVTTKFSDSANELVLFLAAGVLAVGLAAMADLGYLVLPIKEFDAFTASALLAAMIGISMIGIHPIVQIAGLTSVLLAANPDPQLLALTYLFAWSLGTTASPLSGTHLVMQGRYGIPSWKGATGNWPFVLVMYPIGVLVLYLMQELVL